MDIAQVKLPDVTATGSDLRTGSTTNAQKSQNQASFADCLQSQEPSVKSTKTASVSGSGNTQTDSYDCYRYKDKHVDVVNDNDTSDKTAEVKDKADQLKEDVVKSVSDDLGVDEEKVTAAMETLGLTVLDLLNPQKLAQLAKELTGAADDAGLLLNADFKQLLSDVTTLGDAFAETTGVSVEMLAQLTEELTEAAGADHGVLPMETAADDGTTETDTDQSISDADRYADLIAADTAVADGDQENAKVLADDQSQSSDESEDSGPNHGTAAQTVQGHRSDSGVSGTRAGQFTDQLANAVNEAMTEPAAVGETSQTASYTSVDAVDVINQIVEHVRISQGTDTTTIEMQLNPESLGRIYLNISSREGSVHAQLYTQNEEVRLALEAQIATLTENLNQAGIKVDAVEIAVAAHEFERNLEQNAGSGKDQQDEARQREQTSRRSIRLDVVDDPKLALSEEEVLIARMMKDNGNSVDFTA